MRKTPLEALLPGTRARLLAALFGRPDKWWYLSELAAWLHTRPSSLQRDLSGLVGAGILENRRNGNRSYFRPQRGSPIFGELSGLIEKTAGLIPVLARCLAPFENQIDSAFVFGSVARGKERPDSDVDLLIVGRATMVNLIPALRKAEDLLQREINVVHYSAKEFREKAAKGDHFLKTVLQQPKKFVIGSQRDLGKIAA